jgi:hypothetical protein
VWAASVNFQQLPKVNGGRNFAKSGHSGRQRHQQTHLLEASFWHFPTITDAIIHQSFSTIPRRTDLGCHMVLFSNQKYQFG